MNPLMTLSTQSDTITDSGIRIAPRFEVMQLQFGLLKQAVTGPAAHLLLAYSVRPSQLNIVAFDGWKSCLDFLNAEVILFLLVSEQQARSKHVKGVTPAPDG